jgi:hypothetical protein
LLNALIIKARGKSNIFCPVPGTPYYFICEVNASCLEKISLNLLTFRNFETFYYWWAHLGSNQGPTGYEPVALPTEL